MKHLLTKQKTAVLLLLAILGLSVSASQADCASLENANLNSYSTNNTRTDNIMENVTANFLRYVKIDTHSDEDSNSVPSTKGQLTLALLLKDELSRLGAKDLFISETDSLYAKIPSNCGNVPTVGFVAHLDTSPETPSANVKPQIVKNYKGGDIKLCGAENCFIKVSLFPELENYIGQDIITTDGTTLLGADDKAGIAEIMAMVQYLHENPETPHGDIYLFFPTDEEIGCCGSKSADYSRFHPNFAYTVDGGALGEFSYETFNAAEAVVTINGISVHPGSAKGKMKNSMLAASEFIGLMPANEIPALTDGYDGFYHLNKMDGTTEKTVLHILLRNHDKQKFAAQKEFIRTTVKRLNEKYGDGTFCAEITDSYFNMREAIEKHPEAVETAIAAMKRAGIEPRIIPIRGGTDGTNVSSHGIPCPDIAAGGHNFHSRFEYVPVQSMEKTVEILVNIVKGFAETKK